MYLFLLMHNVLQLRMCHWLFVLIIFLLFYILFSTCFHILVFFLIMLLPYNGNVYFLMLIQLHNAICLPIIQWTETPGVVSFSLWIKWLRFVTSDHYYSYNYQGGYTRLYNQVFSLLFSQLLCNKSIFPRIKYSNWYLGSYYIT